MPRFPKSVKQLLTLLCVLAYLATGSVCRAEQTSTDVCVYGGTASGVITAVQVARMGARRYESYCQMRVNDEYL